MDILLCAVVMKRDWAIFTTDPDSRNYARVLPLSIHRARPSTSSKGSKQPGRAQSSHPPRHSRYGASRISGTDPQRRNPKARSEAQSTLTLAAPSKNFKPRGFCRGRELFSVLGKRYRWRYALGRTDLSRMRPFSGSGRVTVEAAPVSILLTAQESRRSPTFFQHG